MEGYTAKLENRKVQETGSISYDLIVIEEDSGEEIVNTDFTVEPRQEEREDFEDMVRNVARKRIEAKKQEKGRDHSGKEVSL